jgi:hypothetical protein
MRNFMKPIRYSYDHCVKVYEVALTIARPEISEGLSSELILQMPGIDYSKIDLARNA